MKNVDDVQRSLFRRRSRGRRVSGVGHCLSPGFLARSEDYTVPRIEIGADE
jgi:hypothetical protein